mmetsp:Transcript_43287/g.112627  ORF Transcript_43287/g.112627 Transcript_43287/m.112627 type:complete len:205 (-) Transcript_43287:513-1127(-)
MTPTPTGWRMCRRHSTSGPPGSCRSAAILSRTPMPPSSTRGCSAWTAMTLPCSWAQTASGGARRWTRWAGSSTALSRRTTGQATPRKPRAGTPPTCARTARAPRSTGSGSPRARCPRAWRHRWPSASAGTRAPCSSSWEQPTRRTPSGSPRPRAHPSALCRAACDATARRITPCSAWRGSTCSRRCSTPHSSSAASGATRCGST